MSNTKHLNWRLYIFLPLTFFRALLYGNENGARSFFSNKFFVHDTCFTLYVCLIGVFFFLFGSHIDVVSSLVFNLEDNLPDELVSGGSNWADNLGGNKPTGPSGNNQQQMNGEDPTGIPNVGWNQHQRPGTIK